MHLSFRFAKCMFLMPLAKSFHNSREVPVPGLFMHTHEYYHILLLVYRPHLPIDFFAGWHRPFCLVFVMLFRSAASPCSVLFGDDTLLNNRGSCSKVVKVLAALLFGVVRVSRVSTLPIQ